MSSEIEEICKKLQNDYSGEVLEKVNDNIKEIFKQIAEEYKDRKKGNIPLLNIVHNYFNGTLPNAKYLSGPMSLSYQTSDEYNMKVYIFGEWHGTEKSCLDFKESFWSSFDMSNYLKEVFLNSDKFIDFYLEDQLFVSTLGYGMGSLDKLRTDFNECLNPNKREKCEFKTIRAHFVDVRQIQKEEIFYATNPLEELIMDLRKYGFKIPKKKQNSKELLKKLGSLKTYESIAKYVLENMLKIPIIQKELSRCYLNEDFLISTFYEIILETFPQFFKIERWIKRVTTKKYLDGLIALLTLIQGPMVDFYTITRMFKRFKNTGHFPEKPKYIIYYAGDIHSNTVRIFLERLKFKKQFHRQSDVKTRTRCLNIEGLTLNFK